MHASCAFWLVLSSLGAACVDVSSQSAVHAAGATAHVPYDGAVADDTHDAGPSTKPTQTSPRDAGTQLDAHAPIRDAMAALDGGDAAAADRDAAHAETDAARQLDASPPDPTLDSGMDDAHECHGPPGLYKDTECQVPSDELQAYLPQYPLWSDGASKERFIYLPAGTHIDTSNPDRWSFPVGTRVYKTFAKGALKIETRVLEKVANATSYASWTSVSYAWSMDQRSVSLADSNGVTHALGTDLDIPSQGQCLSCHSMNAADAVIGFNAIQLNHPDAGLTLAMLLERGLLVDVASGNSVNITLAGSQIPGDAVTKAALGYLHGNCGNCHGGPNPRANQRLWSVAGVTELSAEPIYQSAVCQCLVSWTGRKNSDGLAIRLRVAPHYAGSSGIIGRMSSTTVGERMPPIGTKQVDIAGLSAVQAWIDSLDGSLCDAVGAMCL